MRMSCGRESETKSGRARSGATLLIIRLSFYFKSSQRPNVIVHCNKKLIERIQSSKRSNAELEYSAEQTKNFGVSSSNNS